MDMVRPQFLSLRQAAPAQLSPPLEKGLEAQDIGCNLAFSITECWLCPGVALIVAFQIIPLPTGRV